MKTFKTFVGFSLLTLFLLCFAWQAIAQADTPTPNPTPTPVPVAGFSSNVTTGAVPLMVQFNDTSTGSPTGWQWDFGDLNTSNIENPSHLYSTPGLYTVTLTATNPEGSNTTQKTNYINVTAAPTPTPSPSPSVTPSPTPRPSPSPTPRITPTPKPTKKPTASPTPIVMPTIPPDLWPIINESFATPTPNPTPLPQRDPTPQPTLVPLPPQETSPTPTPGRDHVPGIVAFAGFNVMLIALYAGVSYLFFRK